MDAAFRQVLRDVAERHGTPAYVYSWPEISRRLAALREALESSFRLSYAVKANPMQPLLRRLVGQVEHFDVSSIGEVRLGLEAGMPASRMTFSGPAKRGEELAEAVACGVGWMICESSWELEQLEALAAARGRPLAIGVRLNPATLLRGFGVPMSGRPSPFGFDEEDAGEALARLRDSPHLELGALHVYAATNALDPRALLTSFETSIEMFAGLAASAGLRPRVLIFGAGFGIPYEKGAAELDVLALGEAMRRRLPRLRDDPFLGEAELVLELGRYLVGPAGYFLTRVIGEKTSRGRQIRMVDGGFQAHLAAYGLLGTVVRRNWPIEKLSPPWGGEEEYMLTGPLCTSIDVLAQRINLPELRRGDLLAVLSSGAYGLTASPTEFISHPRPQEILVIDEAGREHELGRAP